MYINMANLETGKKAHDTEREREKKVVLLFLELSELSARLEARSRTVEQAPLADQSSGGKKFTKRDLQQMELHKRQVLEKVATLRTKVSGVLETFFNPPLSLGGIYQKHLEVEVATFAGAQEQAARVGNELHEAYEEAWTQNEDDDPEERKRVAARVVTGTETWPALIKAINLLPGKCHNDDNLQKSLTALLTGAATEDDVVAILENCGGGRPTDKMRRIELDNVATAEDIIALEMVSKEIEAALERYNQLRVALGGPAVENRILAVAAPVPAATRPRVSQPPAQRARPVTEAAMGAPEATVRSSDYPQAIIGTETGFAEMDFAVNEARARELELHPVLLEGCPAADVLMVGLENGTIKVNTNEECQIFANRWHDEVTRGVSAEKPKPPFVPSERDWPRFYGNVPYPAYYANDAAVKTNGNFWFLKQYSTGRIIANLEDRTTGILRRKAPHQPVRIRYPRATVLMPGQPAVNYDAPVSGNDQRKVLQAVPAPLLRALGIGQQGIVKHKRESIDSALWEGDPVNRRPTAAHRQLLEQLVPGQADQFELRLENVRENQNRDNPTNLWHHLDGYFLADDGVRYGLVGGGRSSGGASGVVDFWRDIVLENYAAGLVLSRKQG